MLTKNELQVYIEHWYSIYNKLYTSFCQSPVIKFKTEYLLLINSIDRLKSHFEFILTFGGRKIKENF